VIRAPGRLIITDTATQSRRHVEWGLEGPLTYSASTSLLVDSDDMVTTGFSGAQLAGVTGAFDPNASGNNAITLSPVAGATTAMCGTGNLSHVGVFRVKARVQCLAPMSALRFSWKAGDGPTNHNTWATPIVDSAWTEMDLGTITVPAAVLGTQRWTGQIEVLGDSTTSAPGTVFVDYLILIPTADGYGKARAPFAYTAGVLSAYDDFTATTAGSALNARTAPVGGSWATSGATGDLLFADDFSDEQIKRSAVNDTTPRFAVLGASTFTDSEASVAFRRDASAAGGTTTKGVQQGVILRWVDASNYLRAVYFNRQQGSVHTPAWVAIYQVVAGVETQIARADADTIATGTWYTLRGIAFASGRVVAQILDSAGTIRAVADGLTSAAATGGALASGKPGIADMNSTTATTVNRWYDTFRTGIPAPEPVVLYSGRSMQVRYDDTLRQDATGVFYGRPPSYRGARFLVQVGTSRVLVKARRNDIETAVDDQVTDALQIQIAITPRGLAVPR
jgi:hypothetical protein